MDLSTWIGARRAAVWLEYSSVYVGRLVRLKLLESITTDNGYLINPASVVAYIKAHPERYDADFPLTPPERSTRRFKYSA